jgi:hypothetical protein
MRYRHAKIDIKLKDNFMNIIAYRARQKILGIWHYIREGRLYRKSTTHSG